MSVVFFVYFVLLVFFVSFVVQEFDFALICP